jgi:hypothetical protein
MRVMSSGLRLRNNKEGLLRRTGAESVGTSYTELEGVEIKTGVEWGTKTSQDALSGVSTSWDIPTDGREAANDVGGI